WHASGSECRPQRLIQAVAHHDLVRVGPPQVPVSLDIHHHDGAVHHRSSRPHRPLHSKPHIATTGEPGADTASSPSNSQQTSTRLRSLVPTVRNPGFTS